MDTSDGWAIFLSKGGWKSRSILQAVVFSLGILLIGCAPSQSALTSSSLLTANKDNRTFQVHEYALIEASTDNPNHPSFQKRAQAAVIAQRSRWLFRSSNATQEPNQALAPFGYHIEANPTPPFSGYALYRKDQLIQRDIARFLPVSVTMPDGLGKLNDFTLSFETMNGEKLVADSKGVRPLLGLGEAARGYQKLMVPNQLAYADAAGSEIKVAASAQQLYNGKLAADIFGQQMIDGQPFYFYTGGDLVHLNYAGKDLAYVYDHVEHNNTGANVIFNLGGTGQVTWFYALRDGLWYYVEVGLFA